MAPLPETVEVTPPPQISQHPGPFRYFVRDIGDGRVILTDRPGERFGIKMPAASIRHFVNDLSGRVDVDPKGAPDPAVRAVLEGNAELLGKGDDGVAYRVGRQVVKVSTTVPYIPENDYHRTPEAAVEQLRAQTAMHNHLADVAELTGRGCVQRAEFVAHGDKGFQVKPYVDGAVTFTKAELDALQDCVIGIHRAGYAIRDTIQAGRGPDGRLVMFDVGKATPIPEGRDGAYVIGADMWNLERLYNDAGVPFARRDNPPKRRLAFPLTHHEEESDDAERSVQRGSKRGYASVEPIALTTIAVAGVVAAPRLNTAIKARPLGERVPPSAGASLVCLVGGGLARRGGYVKTGNAGIALGVGLAVGTVLSAKSEGGMLAAKG